MIYGIDSWAEGALENFAIGIDYGYISNISRDDVPPWHDDEPSVACVACIKCCESDQFVFALHATPISQAAALLDNSHLRVSHLEVTAPHEEWQDRLREGALHYLSRQTLGTRRASRRPHPDLFTGVVRWDTTRHRFAVIVQSPLLNIPDFLPWLAVRCNLTEDRYDIFAVDEDTQSRSAGADFAGRPYKHDHQQALDVQASPRDECPPTDTISDWGSFLGVEQMGSTPPAPTYELIKRKDLAQWLKRQVDAWFD